MAHDFSKGLDTVVSDTRSRPEKGYDAGWEQGKEDRKQWRRRQSKKVSGSGYDSNGPDPLGAGVAIGALLAIPALCLLGYYLSNRQTSAPSVPSNPTSVVVSSQRSTLTSKQCKNLIKKLQQDPSISIPGECQNQLSAFSANRTAAPNQSGSNFNQSGAQTAAPTPTSWEEQDRLKREAFQRYNSPEERRRREESANQVAPLTPEQKDDAVQRERRRQEDMQKTFDRFNNKNRR